jgi:hypothetical protein
MLKLDTRDTAAATNGLQRVRFPMWIDRDPISA